MSNHLNVHRLGLMSAAAAFCALALINTPTVLTVGGATAPKSSTVSAASVFQLLGSETSMGASPVGSQGEISIARPAFIPGENSACDRPYGWLQTQGAWIVEAKDTRCKVRLAGVTWYGMQTTSYALAGLNLQPYRAILREVAHLGFNSIRLPLSDELVKDNKQIKISGRWLRKNKDLVGLHPLQLLDRIIAAAKSFNLMVILDNHFSEARAACNVSNDSVIRHAAKCRLTNDTTWAADGYSEHQWVADWQTVAERYKNDPTVIGFDLRNEPHSNHSGSHWTLRDYVSHGATWGPCTVKLCGKLTKLWKPSTNWVPAAEKSGDAIQKIDPHALLFVEGVELYPNPKVKDGVEPYWWGSILKGVASDPVRFTIPNQLVYSPHEWGPWKCCNPGHEFNSKSSYKTMTKIFYDNWAYILSDKSVQAPIWLGEFNTCNSAQPHTRWTYPIKTANGCVYGSKPGSEGQWFHILIEYLRANPEIGWSYYPLNGSNMLDETASNSVLARSWKSVRLKSLISALESIETQPSN